MTPVGQARGNFVTAQAISAKSNPYQPPAGTVPLFIGAII
jgi:hypothetical protein